MKNEFELTGRHEERIQHANALGKHRDIKTLLHFEVVEEEVL